jgi:chromosome segregation ATPase
MATGDQQLISVMKDTIEYQRSMCQKREKLVHAITHNVQYLADIHRKNNIDLKNTKEHLAAIQKWNEQLQDQNNQLKEQCQILQKDQDELNTKREEIAKMVIESQANRNEIEQLHAENQSKSDKMEKLNLEVTVVVTEKMTLKKELDRVDNLYRKMKKEYKEQRVNYNLLVDEVSKLTKQNGEYRGLILSNETKFQQIGQDIVDLQANLELKNKEIQRKEQEAKVYKK